LFWNLITAAFVAAPKYEVSIPGDPAPTDATCVSALELRTCWRLFTSAPVLPSFKFVENVAADAVATSAKAATTKPAAMADFVEINLFININYNISVVWETRGINNSLVSLLSK
jgi:hypothetical protein